MRVIFLDCIGVFGFAQSCKFSRKREVMQVQKYQQRCVLPARICTSSTQTSWSNTTTLMAQLRGQWILYQMTPCSWLNIALSSSMVPPCGQTQNYSSVAGSLLSLSSYLNIYTLVQASSDLQRWCHKIDLVCAEKERKQWSGTAAVSLLVHWLDRLIFKTDANCS